VAEICGDGLDNDCDGNIDTDCLTACSVLVPVDESTINDGIGLAYAMVATDPVCVLPGTYPEMVDFNEREVHVLGLGGPLRTVITPPWPNPGVQIDQGEGADTILEGFTITGGSGEGGSFGGGVYVVGASPTLRHLWIVGNTTAAAGGGVYLSSSDATLTSVWIDGNTANEAGGVAVVGTGTPVLRNVRITANEAVSSRGGGIWVDDLPGSLVLEASIVAGNLAGTAAGGLDVEGAIAMTNVAVVGNTSSTYQAGFSGGGVNTHACNGGPARTFHNSAVTQNEALGVSTGTGGGVCSNVNCPLEVTYSNGWGNIPGNWGCGMAPPTPSAGNDQVDPMWINSSSLLADQWDYHNAPACLTIDDGDPTILDPDGSVSDMGPYGGPYADDWDLDWDLHVEWWQPGPYDHSTYPAAGWDCDDRDPDVHPDHPELFDCKDNDCDGVIPAAETADEDGDGVPACEDPDEP